MSVVAGTLVFPADQLEVSSISKENSILNIWVEEPKFSNASGTISFAGGIISSTGFIGEGKILEITFNPKKEGSIRIDFIEASVLAHDGKGTPVLQEKIGTMYFVRTQKLPSPDVNGDWKITASDMRAVILSLGSSDLRYDLNGDGRVSWADVTIVFTLMMKG